MSEIERSKMKTVKKCSDTEICEAYTLLGSIYKVAEKFGMCHQSVWERLTRLNKIKKMNILTDSEKKKIEDLYQEGFLSGDGKLKKLSKEIGRTVPFISRYAKSKGLTNLKRKTTDELSSQISQRSKKWIREKGHPRGMLGKNHSDEMRSNMSIRVKNDWINMTDEKKQERSKKLVITSRKRGVYNRKHGSWKQDWRTIGGKKKYFRSRWEANYARYLEFLKKQCEILDWLHEPQTFWFEKIKRGSRSYLPDFKVINLDESYYWVEVKGWFDDRSKTKLKRFKLYYPDEKLEIIDSKWFKRNLNLKNIILDWE